MKVSTSLKESATTSVSRASSGTRLSGSLSSRHMVALIALLSIGQLLAVDRVLPSRRRPLLESRRRHLEHVVHPVFVLFHRLFIDLAVGGLAALHRRPHVVRPVLLLHPLEGVAHPLDVPLLVLHDGVQRLLDRHR